MSQTQNEKPALSLPAAADLRTHQFKLISVDSAGAAALCGAGLAGAFIVGNAPNTGEPAELYDHGFMKVILGATVAAGAKVMSDATGRAITATATNHVVGICIQGGAVGEVGSIWKIPPTILA